MSQSSGQDGEKRDLAFDYLSLSVLLGDNFYNYNFGDLLAHPVVVNPLMELNMFSIQEQSSYGSVDWFQILLSSVKDEKSTNWLFAESVQMKGKPITHKTNCYVL
ncbi:unnamed protein product [Trifolium pratense]|uniref:Uncharacterized protein n=1 Tax=Trifolium pratense TaxID=57577 RepID=A0ACB0KA36_TRIPR|nr:unnamed protein product [Trifolium pratense]